MENENCIDACTSKNLECSEQNFHQRNSDIDTSDELIRLIWGFGGGIPAWSCRGTYGNSSDVPSVSSIHTVITHTANCFHSSPSRELSTFNCSALPIAHTDTYKGRLQRICWCNTAGNINCVFVKYEL